MSLSETTRRKWWINYEEFDAELDKLSYKELNYLLKSKISDADSHITNKEIHVTKEEKDRWNSFTGYPIATKESDGLISSEDKEKLNHLADNANHYEHPSYNGSVLRNIYQYRIDNYGHITDILSVEYLPVSVNNVYKFGGLDYSRFIPVETTNFYKLSSPDVDPSLASNFEKLVNVKTVKEYTIDSAVIQSESFPTDHRKLFFNQSNQTLYYFDEKHDRWSSIVSVDPANIIGTDSNGKIDVSMINQNSMPIGSIITINSKTGLNNSKYLLCDGSTINRADYPELFRLIDSGSIPTISNREYEDLFTVDRNIGTKYKSCYSFVRTADENNDKIILPLIHMVNLRAQSYISDISEVFFKENSRNISGEMPVFNFYDKYTNTMLKVSEDDIGSSGETITVEDSLSYVQNPFDKWSGYASTPVRVGGSYYSYPNPKLATSSPLTDVLAPVDNGFVAKYQEEKNWKYNYDNSNTYNTSDENCPASTYVSAYVRVRE